MKHKEAFSDYIESNKPALFTGNSFEMLGKGITDCEGKAYDGLDLFKFFTTEQNKKRLTADAIFESDFSDKLFVGFVNKCSEINGIEAHARTCRQRADRSLGREVQKLHRDPPHRTRACQEPAFRGVFRKNHPRQRAEYRLP